MATLDLVLIIPMVVASSMFLVDCALGSYYKERLSFVAMQAANFAANLPFDQEPVKPTEKVVKDLLQKMNAGCANLKVTVKPITVGEQDALSVELSANMPLLRGGVLPGTIGLQENAVCIIPANKVCAAVAINPYPYSYDQQQSQVPCIYVPVIQPRHNMPVWQFPYDTAINNLHIVQGSDPGIANRVNHYYQGHPSLY